MAKRVWMVWPDHTVQTADGGTVAAVSQQALAQAVVDGVVVLHRAGGVLGVSVNRVATGVPNERVTASAAVEWKDRVDARAQAEPEQEPAASVEQAIVAAEAQTPMMALVGSDAHGNDVDEQDVPAELRGG